MKNNDLKGVFVFHIGRAKTGSTFLQKNIFAQMKNINLMGKIKFKDFELKDCINIISDETITEKNDFITYMLSIKKCFPDVKIIYCSRNDKDYFKSVYKTYLMLGYPYSFNRFVGDSKVLSDYNICKFLKHNFKDNLYIYNFNWFKNNKIELINSLCNFIGYKGFIKFDNAIVNKSISSFGCFFLRVTNRILFVFGVNSIMYGVMKFIRKDW